MKVSKQDSTKYVVGRDNRLQKRNSLYLSHEVSKCMAEKVLENYGKSWYTHREREQYPEIVAILKNHNENFEEYHFITSSSLLPSYRSRNNL